MKRYFEYKDENSSKFWEITLESSGYTVRFGKIGTKGTARTKEFDSQEAAAKDAEKMIKAKVKKGYEERTGRQPSAPEEQGKSQPAGAKPADPTREGLKVPIQDIIDRAGRQIKEFQDRYGPFETVPHDLEGESKTSYDAIAEPLIGVAEHLSGLSFKDLWTHIAYLCGFKDWFDHNTFVEFFSPCVKELANKDEQVQEFSTEELWQFVETLGVLWSRGWLNRSVYQKIALLGINELISRDKKGRTALLYKARFFLENNRYQQAVSLCNRLIKANPEEHEAHYIKAQSIYFRVQNKKLRQETIEGLQSINKAVELNPHVPEYWNTKQSYLSDFKRCEEHTNTDIHLKGAYREFYDDFPAMLADEAVCYQNMIDLDRDTFGTEDYKGPLGPTSLSLYCYLLEDLGRFDQALTYLEQQFKMETAEIERLYKDRDDGPYKLPEDQVAENRRRRHERLDRIRCDYMDRKSRLYESLGKAEEALANMDQYIEEAALYEKVHQEKLLLFDPRIASLKRAKFLRILGREEEALSLFDEQYRQYRDSAKRDTHFERIFLEGIGRYDEILQDQQNALNAAENKLAGKATSRMKKLEGKKELYPLSTSWKSLIAGKFDTSDFDIEKKNASLRKTGDNETPKGGSLFDKMLGRLKASKNRSKKAPEPAARTQGLQEEDYRFVQSLGENATPRLSVEQCLALLKARQDTGTREEDTETIIVDGHFISLRMESFFRGIEGLSVQPDFSVLKKLEILDYGYPVDRDVTIKNLSLRTLIHRPRYNADNRLHIVGCPNLTELTFFEHNTVLVCTEIQKDMFLPRKRKNIEVYRMDSLERHQFVLDFLGTHRVADDADRYQWIVSRKDCEKATALLIFWRLKPLYWHRLTEEEWEEKCYCRHVFKTIKKQYLSGWYKNRNAGFDPRDHKGTDYTKDYDKAALKQEIDPAFFEPVAGSAAGVRTGRLNQAGADSAAGEKEQAGEAPTCSELFQEILDHIRELGEDYHDEYESLRDEIHDLGPQVMAPVLETALKPEADFMLDLLAIVLADVAYPPAMEHFVRWLDHKDENVRYTAASALDSLAGGRFGIENMVEKGWVQYDQVDAAALAVKAWWEAEGRHNVPDLGEWEEKRARKRDTPDREKRFNFVKGNPGWVLSGTGSVYKIEGPLPRHSGTHIIGGTVLIEGEAEPRFAVLELDSHRDAWTHIAVKEETGWKEVTNKTAWVQPKGTVESIDEIYQQACEIYESEGMGRRYYDLVLKNSAVIKRMYETKRDGETGINLMHLINNFLIAAFAIGKIREGIAAADAFQEYAYKNNYFFHSAACLYVADKQFEKALTQLELAKKHGYPLMDRIKNDRDLEPLFDDDRFKALF